jgi:hypothetical protein
VTTLRFVLVVLACVIFGACAADPPPPARLSSEYLATIKRDPAVATIRVFVGPSIIRQGTWSDDEEPRIIRAAAGDALAAMGFTLVKLDNDADAIARVRVVRGDTPTQEIEFLRGELEVDSFRLEDTAMSYGDASKEDRITRAYSRMLAARSRSITHSPKILALAQLKREAAPTAKAPPPPKPDTKPAAPTTNDREKAIAWMQSTTKAAERTATFTQQLDGAIASGQDAQWQLGWGTTKDGMARIARWRAGAFESRAITPVEATQAGIAETSSTFTTHVRGSLGPLGPSSAPPPPTSAPPPPPPLPPNTETGKGRDAAIAWLNAHAKAPATAASIVEQIDDVIRAGTRGEWKIGWALMQGYKAYFFAYSADGSFQATELTVADAQAQGYKAYAVTFAKY